LTQLAITILYTYALALLPVVEGRYAVLAGVGLGLPPHLALLASSLGVATLALVIPGILPRLDSIARRLSEEGPFKGPATAYLRYLERVRSRSRRLVDRYGLVGLALFVAIPLPATGVWTGALAAYILGVKARGAMLALLLGGVVSNILVLLLSSPAWA